MHKCDSCYNFRRINKYDTNTILSRGSRGSFNSLSFSTSSSATVLTKHLYYRAIWLRPYWNAPLEDAESLCCSIEFKMQSNKKIEQSYKKGTFYYFYHKWSVEISIKISIKYIIRCIAVCCCLLYCPCKLPVVASAAGFCEDFLFSPQEFVVQRGQWLDPWHFSAYSYVSLQITPFPSTQSEFHFGSSEPERRISHWERFMTRNSATRPQHYTSFIWLNLVPGTSRLTKISRVGVEKPWCFVFVAFIVP